MAGGNRHPAGRMRQLADELNYCQAQVAKYQGRIDDLERERQDLMGGGRQEGETSPAPEPTRDPPAAPGFGGLGQLMNSLRPEDVQQMAEVMKGIDLKGVIGALTGGQAGGGAGGPLAGLLGGPPGGLPGVVPGDGPAPAGLLAAAAPALGGGLASFLPAPRLNVGGALSGISEIVGFFNANPLKGRKWSFKDASALMKLAGSPNVQSLVGTARAAPGLIKAGRQLMPLVAALRKAQPEKKQKRGGRGRQRGSAKPQVTANPPEPPPPAPVAATPIQFHLSSGPPPVLEPWRAT